MDLALILTYRCNSKCSMCHVWRNPSLPTEELSLSTLDKIPHGLDHLNLTGGEPTLRQDLEDIVDLLYPRAATFEISSNGLNSEKLDPIVRKHPKIKIRFSLEGSETTNNGIRGEKDGFGKKLYGLLRLKAIGGRDLGFAATIQDDNAGEVVDLFRLCQQHGFELSTSTLHNGFQFHKNDNVPYDRLRVARGIQDLIVEQLRTRNVKNWFRAYMNLGLIAKVLGQDRILPCTAGSDFVFVDPWGDVFACNVRPDLELGNLQLQTWHELLNGQPVDQVRKKVAECKQNCWMVGSAKTAMRNPRYARLPKIMPAVWVVENGLRVACGANVPFEKYLDYSNIHQDPFKPRRPSYLDQSCAKRVQAKDDVHYTHLGDFVNR